MIKWCPQRTNWVKKLLPKTKEKKLLKEGEPNSSLVVGMGAESFKCGNINNCLLKQRHFEFSNLNATRD